MRRNEKADNLGPIFSIYKNCHIEFADLQIRLSNCIRPSSLITDYSDVRLKVF
jgi:hypothetical protein